MSRFYFDVSTGESSVTDDEGDELRDADAARDCAIGVLRDLFPDQTIARRRRDIVVFVRDDGGRVLEARLSLDVKWVRRTPYR